jgi:non-ribosomal peptide synthetase component F
MSGTAFAPAGWRLADALAARRISMPMMSPRRRCIAVQVDDTEAIMALALAVARLTGQRSIAMRDLDVCRADGDPFLAGVGAGYGTLRFDLSDDVTLGALREQVATAGANCAAACAEVAIARSAWMAHQALTAEDAPLAVLLLDAEGCAVLTAPERLDAVAAGCLHAAMEQGLRVVEGAPECRLGAVSVLSACARANLLCRFQAGQQSTQSPQSLLDRLAQLAEGDPAAILLRQGTRHVDAATLWHQTGVAAAALHARGLGRGQRVAVIGPRSIDHVLALLAILRSGADAVLLGTQSSGASGSAVDAVVVHDGTRWSLSEPQEIVYETLAAAEVPEEAGAPALDVRDRGNVICAGITRPVVMSADALMRSIEGVGELQIGAGCSALWWSQPGSPAALLEILAPLIRGGCCVVPASPAGTLDALTNSLRHEAVDVATLPGDMIERAMRLDTGVFAGLRELLVRDDLPAGVLRQLQRAMPRLRLSGIHGGDGCPLAAIVTIPRPLPAQWRRIPVGLPVAGIRIHVLAPDGGLLPVGAVGELHVGGCGVAVAGSREDRELIVSRRFVCDPYGSPGQRLFRTGVCGRRLPDGCIERVDRHRHPVGMPREAALEHASTTGPWLNVQPDGDQQGVEIAG